MLSLDVKCYMPVPICDVNYCAWSETLRFCGSWCNLQGGPKK